MDGGQGFENFIKQQLAPQGGAGFGAGRFMQGVPGQQGFPGGGQQGAGFPGQTPLGGGLMPWDFQAPTPAMPTPPPLFQSAGPLSTAAGPATRRRQEPPHDPGR